jgi:hypothetical protein
MFLDIITCIDHSHNSISREIQFFKKCVIFLLLQTTKQTQKTQTDRSICTSMRGQEMFGRGKEEKHKEKKRVANE